MARDELAGAAGASEARIDAFETDNAMPMFRQLRLIGKLDGTLAFFFTTPPTQSCAPGVVDFRGHDGDTVPPLLTWEMRRAEQHRKAALKLEPTGTSLGCTRRGSQSWHPTLSKTFRARQKRWPKT